MSNGTITFRTAVIREAPRFTAASSSSPEVCSRPETVERTIYGKRRIAYAMINNGNGLGFSPNTSRLSQVPSKGPPAPNGQRRVIATYPNAMTSPGTARGNMHNASSNERPLIVVRTIRYPMSTPNAMFRTIAINDRINEFLIELNDSLAVSASLK